MSRLLCFVGIHDWQWMKWGTAASLDCRKCRRCHRFEVYAYGSYHQISNKTSKGRKP